MRLIVLIVLACTPTLRALEGAHRAELDEAFARLDVAAASAYLEANADAIRQDSPRMYANYHFQVLLWQCRVQDARDYRTAAIAADGGLAEDPVFKRLSEALDGFPDLPPKLLLDYELDGNLRLVKQLDREGKKIALYRRIREIMEASGDQVVLTDDPDLFRGAADAYRAAFSEYQAAYDSYLTDYVAGLAQATSLNAAQQAQLVRQLSLARSAAPTPHSLATGVPALPKSLAPAAIVGDLLDGNMEQLAAFDTAEREVREPRLGSPTQAGELQIVQTSRELVGLRAGAVAWRFSMDPSHFDPNRDEYHGRNALRVMPLTAAAADGLVVARLMTDGEFHLFGVDAASGIQRWEFSSDNLDLCGDPIIWQQQVYVVARKRVTPVEYHLLSLDLQTGEARQTDYLYGAGHLTHYIESLTKFIELDRFMPPITVADDTAYISTNAGLLVAFDLARGAVQWARVYQRPHYPLGETLARLPIQRQVSPAVVGRDTVVFAPLDALRLVAVDRRTGAPLAASSDIQWSAIRALPGDRALVRSSDGLRLTVLSLADLTPQAELTADQPWQWASDPEGRLLLQRGRELGVLTAGATPTFAARGTLPPDTTLLTGDTQRLLLSQRIADGFALLTTGGEAAQPVQRAPSRELVDGRFQQIAGHHYAIGENAVIRLDEALQPVWSCGVPERPAFVVADGDDLLVAFDHHAWAVDGATGRVAVTFPAADSPWIHITVVTDGPDGPLLGIDTEGDSCAVYAWNHGAPEVFGRLTNEDNVAAILKQGQAVVGQNHWSARTYTLDTVSKTYKRLDDQSKGMDLGFRDRYGYSLEDGSFVYMNDYQGAVRFDGETLSTIALDRKGTLNNHSYSYSLSHDVLRTNTWDSKALLYVVDLRHQRDLSTTLFAARAPYVDGDFIVGYSAGNGKSIEGWSYDRKTGVRSDPEPILVNKHDAERLMDRNKLRTDFALRLDDRVYSVMGSRDDRPGRLARRMVIQHVVNGAGEAGHLPGYIRGTDALAANGYVLIACNGGLLRITEARFRQLASERIAVAGVVDRDFNCLVDGFLDEWPATDYVTIGMNRLQVRSSLKQTYVAMEIRDPVLIQRLCEPGALEALHLVFGPGDGMETSVSMARLGGSLCAPLLDGATPGLTAAISISPSADRLYLEAISNAEEREDQPQKWNRIFIGRGDDPLRLGDLAIDLKLRDADGRSYQSLLSPDDPTGTPRFILNKK